MWYTFKNIHIYRRKLQFSLRRTSFVKERYRGLMTTRGSSSSPCPPIFIFNFLLYIFAQTNAICKQSFDPMSFLQRGYFSPSSGKHKKITVQETSLSQHLQDVFVCVKVFHANGTRHGYVFFTFWVIYGCKM